jgi:hypothetical protein
MRRLGPLGTGLLVTHLAVRTGLKCMQCHVNRTGGGGRNDFGAVWSQTVLPARTLAPRSRRLADWVGIGLDVRARFDWALNDGVTPQTAFELNEANIYLEANLIPDVLTVYVDQSLGPDEPRARELFAMAAWKPLNGYAKAGKFMLPYGLRLFDDAEFIRSETGFTFATQDVGVEVGIEPGPLSWFVSATNGSFSGTENNNQKMFTTSAVLTFPWFRVGASGAHNSEPGRKTDVAGAFAGFRVGPVVVMGEADLVFDSFDDPAQSDRDQVVAFVEGDWLIVQGLNLKLSYGFHDPTADIRDGAVNTPDDERARARLGIEAFPVSYVQVSGFYTHLNNAPGTDNLDVIALEAHIYF